VHFKQKRQIGTKIFVSVIQPCMNTSLLKHNHRLKQRVSLPLNAARGAGGSEFQKSPSVVRGKAPVRDLGKSPPEADAFCTFTHNILTPHGQKLLVSGHSGHQWTSGESINFGAPERLKCRGPLFWLRGPL